MGAKQAKSIKRALQNPETISKVQEAYTALDTDTSGGLERKEWTIFITQMLDLHDCTSHEGHCHGHTNITETAQEEFINRMFILADLDRDGIVSFNEFNTFLQQDQHNILNDGMVFGARLSSALQVSSADGVPTVCAELIASLRNKDLDTLGIFRVPGIHDSIMSVRTLYDEGKDVNLAECNIHDVAGVLKLYFKMLPEPLIPSDRYQEVVTLGHGDMKLDALAAFIQTIPRENRQLLQLLMGFLNEVSQHSTANEMRPENLSICFSPNLIRAPEGSDPRAEQMNLGKTARVITFCISDFGTVFGRQRR